MPGDQPRRSGTQESIENLPGDGSGLQRQRAEERGQQHRVERRVMDACGHAREIGMSVAVTAPQRRRQSCVEAVVVKDSDERLIQRENPDRQRGGRGDETGLYLAGKRQAMTLRGTNRLYRRM